MAITPRADPSALASPSLTTTQTDRQIRQVNTNLAYVYPTRTPFFALTDKLSKVSDGKANKYEWMLQSDYPRRVTVLGTTAANGTQVAADGTAIFVSPATALVAGDIVQDTRSGEQIRITSNTAGALVVGTRGNYGGGDPLALSDGDQLYILSSAKEENDIASGTKGQTPEMFYNYYQTLERDFAYSERAKNIMYYGPQENSHQEMMALSEFNKDIEKLCLFGQRSGPVAGTYGNVWTAGGLRYWIEQAGNVHDVNGQFTFSGFMKIMAEHARVGGGGLYWGFASSRVIELMQEWQLQFQRSDMMGGTTKKFGLSHTDFVGSNWRVMMIPSESFEEDDVYSQQIYMVHSENVIRHTMRGMGVKVNRGIESPSNTGKHGYKDQITATVTLEVPNYETHAIIDGIAA